ncbi:MAG TPA: methane monooxygenase/ammonia monooxygenase subunit C [Methylocystis sp.]|nr:methane monooxygenase/ammonia monooxygenase subunit C [Methylocystis sp.]
MTVKDIAATQGVGVQTQTRLSRRTLLIGAPALFAFAAALRLYEEFFGWSTGLDSFSPEYQLYWSNLLTAGVAAAFLAAIGVVGYFWRTRDRHLDALAPREEVSRLFTLAQWLTLFALALFFGLSFFTEQTAVWHMTAVRDTDFTPSNIITFYIAYPTFVVLGLAAYFYAKTRLPLFAKGYALAFVVLVVGTFMTLPNVAFNEWGHTFWSLDEGFAGPLHWGFVFFGWMSLGSFGVTLLILGRLRALLGEEGVKALR